MSIEDVSDSESTHAQADDGQSPKDPAKETKKAASGESQDESTDDSATSEDGDQDEGEENDAENQDDQGDEDPKPKRNKVKNRIDKLRGRISERDQMIAQRDREIEFLRQQYKSQEKSEPQANEAMKSVLSNEPDPQDFESNAAYYKAVVRWENAVIAQEQKAKEEETKLKETYAKREADHQARVKEYEASTPGYRDRVNEFLEDYGQNGDYQFSPALFDAFTDESGGPALMDELLKTPEELVRINGLSYPAALRALGRVEARIQSKKENSENSAQRTSKAPAPVQPIGKGVVPVSKSLSDPNLPFADYEKLRKKQLNKRK